MKTDFYIRLPVANQGAIKEAKDFIEKEASVKSYSLDDDFKIVEGIGTFEKKTSWVHSKYDDKEETMYFNDEWRYWTPSLEKIMELRKKNINRYRIELESELKRINNL